MQNADRVATRTVFVLIGSALALALALLDVTLIVLMVQEDVLATWAEVVVAALLVLVPLVALGLLPAMRTVQAAAAASLLGAEVATTTGPGLTLEQRTRTLAWFMAHIVSGALVVAGVLGSLATEDALLAVPAAVGTLALAAVLGAGLARLAPLLLGPSYAERLAALEHDLDRAVERQRLAREIHDSVGHALSLITVQAGAAQRTMPENPGFTVTALAAIESAARGAAADLDHVLGLLREDGNPSPTQVADLGDLEDLVRATRVAGLSVQHRIEGELHGLPSEVSRAGYRLVQESLTNALRYSADGSANLTVVRTPRELRVEVDNLLAPQRPATRLREGRGLRGLSERVRALGGTFQSAATDDRWRLTAAIPLPAPTGRTTR